MMDRRGVLAGSLASGVMLALSSPAHAQGLGLSSILGRASDSALNKPTFPSIIGLQASIEKAQELHRNALQALSIFGEEADILRYISAWFVERKN